MRDATAEAAAERRRPSCSLPRQAARRRRGAGEAETDTTPHSQHGGEVTASLLELKVRSSAPPPGLAKEQHVVQCHLAFRVRETSYILRLFKGQAWGATSLLRPCACETARGVETVSRYITYVHVWIICEYCFSCRATLSLFYLERYLAVDCLGAFLLERSARAVKSLIFAHSVGAICRWHFLFVRLLRNATSSARNGAGLARISIIG